MNTVIAIGVLIIFFFLLWALFYFLFAGVLQTLRLWLKHLSEKIIRPRIQTWKMIKHPLLTTLRQYLPLAIILLMGIVATLVAGDLFLDLAEDFKTSDSLIYKADHAVNSWFVGERQFGLTDFFRVMTHAAGPVGLGILVTAVALYLFSREKIASTIFVMATAIGGFLLNAGLKMIFMRARPDVATAIAIADWYSFPSGHAMASFIILGSMAYLTLRIGKGWFLKTAIFSLIVMTIILVGMSRLYLGVHWTSDIIAGWSAGAVWLAATTVGYETLIRLRHIRHQRTSVRKKPKR